MPSGIQALPLPSTLIIIKYLLHTDYFIRHKYLKNHTMFAGAPIKVLQSVNLML